MVNLLKHRERESNFHVFLQREESSSSLVYVFVLHQTLNFRQCNCDMIGLHWFSRYNLCEKVCFKADRCAHCFKTSRVGCACRQMRQLWLIESHETVEVYEEIAEVYFEKCGGGVKLNCLSDCGSNFLDYWRCYSQVIALSGILLSVMDKRKDIHESMYNLLMKVYDSLLDSFLGYLLE